MNPNNNEDNSKEASKNDLKEPQEDNASVQPVVAKNAISSSSGISSLQSSSEPDASASASDDAAQGGSSESSYIDYSREPRTEGNEIAPAHRRPNFPESLYAILSNDTMSTIITWMPHGRSFKILNSALFSSQVLPRYYRHSNLSSFLR